MAERTVLETSKFRIDEVDVPARGGGTVVKHRMVHPGAVVVPTCQEVKSEYSNGSTSVFEVSIITSPAGVSGVMTVDEATFPFASVNSK